MRKKELRSGNHLHATVIEPGVESCGNGIDDDCDGETDENCDSEEEGGGHLKKKAGIPEEEGGVS